MSWRRKRSKGSRDNPVVGAFVIKRGGGGGEKASNKLEPHVAAERRVENKRVSFLDRKTKDARYAHAVHQAGIKARKRKEQERREALRERAALARKSKRTLEWVCTEHEQNPGMMAVIHRDTHLERYTNEA